MKKDIQSERLVRLEWQGPFSYGPNGLAESILDRFGPTKEELVSLFGQSGLYCIIGDHPLHGARSLLYIGRTNNIERRFKEHDWWVRQEWRVEIYLAKLEDRTLLEDVERLLVYAHTPHYNSVSIAGISGLKNPLRIWNEGRYWKLYPEVSSLHHWYKDE
jgi:hypothetical protein